MLTIIKQKNTNHFQIYVKFYGIIINKLQFKTSRKFGPFRGDRFQFH